MVGNVGVRQFSHIARGAKREIRLILSAGVFICVAGQNAMHAKIGGGAMEPSYAAKKVNKRGIEHSLVAADLAFTVKTPAI